MCVPLIWNTVHKDLKLQCIHTNAQYASYFQRCLKSPYSSYGAQCQQLLTIAKDAFLNQMVYEPTRVTVTSSSILRMFLTYTDIRINQTWVVPPTVVPTKSDCDVLLCLQLTATSFFLPHQNLAKSHHLSSGAKDSKPLKYINTDIREQNIYDYD